MFLSYRKQFTFRRKPLPISLAEDSRAFTSSFPPQEEWGNQFYPSLIAETGRRICGVCQPNCCLYFPSWNWTFPNSTELQNWLYDIYIYIFFTSTGMLKAGCRDLLFPSSEYSLELEFFNLLVCSELWEGSMVSSSLSYQLHCPQVARLM